MQCQNCGKEILPGDAFCPYCGVDIKKAQAEKRRAEEEMVKQEEKKKDEYSSSLSENPKRTNYPLEQGSFSDQLKYYYVDGLRKTYKRATIILSFILITGIILAGYGYMKFDYALKDKNSEIVQLNSKLSEVNSELKAAETNPVLTYYDSLIKYLQYENLGSSEGNYKADKSIYILKRFESQTITLTGKWNKECTVSWKVLDSHSEQPERPPFDLKFGEWDRNNNNPMQLTGVNVGLALIEFSNTLDNGVFRVIVIVTE